MTTDHGNAREPLDAMLKALASNQPSQRYTTRLSKTAEVILRRVSRPHKWRGRGRSMRHLRPVIDWLRSVNALINTPEVYAEIDSKIAKAAGQIVQGRPPWVCESDVPPRLREVRFAQRISNL